MGNGSLLLQNVREDHEGFYLCHASNGGGDAGAYFCQATNVYGRDQQLVQLAVQEPPASPAALEVVMLGGRSASVRWQPSVSGEVAQYFVHYIEDTGSWDQSRTVAVPGSAHSAVLEPLTPATRYTVRVIAQGPAGRSAPSPELRLTTHAQRPAGPPLQLSVTPVSSSALAISWSPPRSELQHGNIASYNVGFRLASPAEGGDAGAYFCQATNVYGRDQQLVQLAVQEPPASPAALEVVMLGGRSASVRWQPSVSGEVAQYFVHYIEDTGSWDQSRTVAVPGSAHSAVLEPLTPATRYTVRVIAQGPAGRSAPSPELRLTTHAQRPAGPPLQLSVTPVSSSALAISWSPPRSELQHGNIASYNVGFRLASGSGSSYNFTSVTADGEEARRSLLLSGLRKFSRYWVAVQAVNQEGPGPLSEPIAATTLEDVPSRPPQEVHCVALSAQSLQVSWQPPSPAHTHGQLQGYRVLYEPSAPEHEAVMPESRQTQALTAVLSGLARHANYSVQVAAVTGAGDGPLSRAVFCKTAEDVPDAPRDIKVVASAPMALLVSWLPPSTPRGLLTGYTLHCRLVLPSSQQSPAEQQPPRALPPAATSLELTGLRAGAEYQFWVTAATRVGEGPATRVVAAVPGIRVPARISSFGEHVTRAWRSTVTLLCNVVGQPSPSREWFRDASLVPTRHTADGPYVAEDGSLRIDSATRGDHGNYSCHVRNNEGADRVIYRLTIQEVASPELITRNSASKPFYTEIRIIVPLVVSCFAVLGATLAACLCWRNKNEREEGKQARLENAHNAEQQYYATIHKLGEKVPECAEDISPYATFHLAETAPRTSHTPRRGPQPAAPGPPHLLHAFVQLRTATNRVVRLKDLCLLAAAGVGREYCLLLLMSLIVERQRVSQVYGPQQQQHRRRAGSSSGRKNNKLAGFDSSDDFRLHSPTPPADSEDSDPEQPTSSLYQGAASSTSSDLSPTSDRKSLPRRGKPGRSRWQQVTGGRVQQQQSRLHSPAARVNQQEQQRTRGRQMPAYSELQPSARELSEAECDIDTLKKLKLRAASSLWSRPTSHQHSPG
ncbi:hypothetical protein B566_EDAN006522, partial [Ephemera danica]